MRPVVILVFPDFQALDAVGPAEVFSLANRLGGDEHYRVELVSSAGVSLRTSSDVEVTPRRAITSVRGAIDTLMVAGGPGISDAMRDERLVTWVAAAAARARRVASVCNGAFLLAEAGLLDGRRATTHWAECENLQDRYPAIKVDPDPIFVSDPPLYTSAGVTAGIDLSLAMVEDDAGAALARNVARGLVLFLRRPGNQAQFSSRRPWHRADREPLRDLQAWIAENLDAELSVAVLAERAYMSERNFARAFRREVGMTPAAYVEAVRLERARAELESGSVPIEAIAQRCGFGSIDSLRQAFQRHLKVNPAAYRSRFHNGGERDADRNTAV